MTTTPGSEADEALGWSAMDGALAAVYGGAEPRHWGTARRWSEGGPDPLDGLSAYRGAEPPHWHYVGYGLSELYDKQSDLAHQSGWGFELTFRLASPEAEPPTWPLGLLQKLARYVEKTGRPFVPGAFIPLGGPLHPDAPTDLVAILFVPDPKLGRIQTPHGALTFLQVVGITADELDLIWEWRPEGMAEALAEGNPLLVTDLARTSVLADPARGPALRARVAREGASEPRLTDPDAQVRVTPPPMPQAMVSLDARSAALLARLIRGRLPHGHEAALVTRTHQVALRPAERAGWAPATGGLALDLPAALAEAVARDLVKGPGTYRWRGLDDLAVKVT